MSAGGGSGELGLRACARARISPALTDAMRAAEGLPSRGWRSWRALRGGARSGDARIVLCAAL